MPLSPGVRLGSYEIVGAIGAGGMGEVYRARDTRLQRDVAIKVLPDVLASNLDHYARFEREARAVAALSHPGIMAIHDFGTAGTTSYAVMELLEGETLRERLAHGPLPPRKAVEYAVQIARALAAAHDKGIVHRDLKPENLFITRDDRTKILDFGLAREVAPPPAAGDETYSPGIRHTDPGTVLGTVGYMSPEQVRGEAGDQRSDIFAFGAVLYEMVTGRRAFDAGTPAETMSAILRDDPPDPLAIAPLVPPAIGRIIWHCLEKKSEARFRSMSDLAFALETSTGVSTTPMPVAVGGASRLRSARSTIAAAALAIAASALAFWIGRQASAPATAKETTFRQLTFESGVVSRARFAPDGHTIIYSASWQGQPSRVFLTRMDQAGSTRLSFPDATVLAVSPSGEIAISIERRMAGSIEPQGTLALSPMLGGSPRAILEHVTSADWSASNQLAVVRVDGGRQRLESPLGTTLFESDGEIGSPRFSPRGDLIAFLDWPVRNDDRGAVMVVDMAGARRTITGVWEAVRGLAWSPNGDEVWFTAQPPGGDYELRAATLDGAGRLIYRAPGSLLLQDVQRDGKVLLAAYARTIRAGALLEGDAAERDLSVFQYSFARDISPDGRIIALSYAGAGSGSDYAVYVRNVDGSEPTRIGEGQAQQFSPDGRWVLSVAHGPPVRLLLLPTGPGQAQTVAVGNVTVTDARWLGPRRLLVIGTESGRGRRAYVIDLDGGAPRAISPEGIGFAPNMLAVAHDGTRVALRAPDGRIMLYSVNDDTSSAVPGLVGDEMPIGWTPDSQALLVVASGQTSRIDRVDAATGRRERWIELRPPDPELLDGRPSIALARNGRSYAANYARVRTTLFLVDGLK